MRRYLQTLAVLLRLPSHTRSRDVHLRLLPLDLDGGERRRGSMRR